MYLLKIFKEMSRTGIQNVGASLENKNLNEACEFAFTRVNTETDGKRF